MRTPCVWTTATICLSSCIIMHMACCGKVVFQLRPWSDWNIHTTFSCDVSACIQASSTACRSYGSPHYPMHIDTMCMICHACIFSWLQVFNQQLHRNIQVLQRVYICMNVCAMPELWGIKESHSYWLQLESVHINTQIPKNACIVSCFWHCDNR